MPSKAELLLRNRWFLVGTGIVLGIVLLGLIGPSLTLDPNARVPKREIHKKTGRVFQSIHGRKAVRIANNLNEEKISPELENVFAMNENYKLSDFATVMEVFEENQSWKIGDLGTPYLIENEKGKLNIYVEVEKARGYIPPISDHPLGLNTTMNDIFARLLSGIRNSLFVALIGGVIAISIALMFGGVLSYMCGLWDDLSNAIANIMLSLPQLVFFLLIASAIPPENRSLLLVGTVIGLVQWPWMARSIRSQVLSLKERKFVDLAKITGKGDMKISIAEVLPNMLSYIFLVFILAMSSAIIIEASISAIGLGPQLTTPTLGNILKNAIDHEALTSFDALHWMIPPGLIVVFFAGTLILLNSIIDDVLNPKSREI